mmetsp:Transcript_66363/g.186933  ORF Transcript_66363/g.186933 Transcript_66363/m.186933 type:complete len:227 (-) Transcript_66363:184-864(-)
MIVSSSSLQCAAALPLLSARAPPRSATCDLRFCSTSLSSLMVSSCLSTRPASSWRCAPCAAESCPCLSMPLSCPSSWMARCACACTSCSRSALRSRSLASWSCHTCFVSLMTFSSSLLRSARTAATSWSSSSWALCIVASPSNSAIRARCSSSVCFIIPITASSSKACCIWALWPATACCRLVISARRSCSTSFIAATSASYSALLCAYFMAISSSSAMASAIGTS